MSLKIYTKTGDDGTTGLFGGGRLPKDALRIEAYGDVDELNSAIGFARSLMTGAPAKFDGLLGSVQDALFVLGADLATPAHQETEKFTVPRIDEAHVTELERAIDEAESGLPMLKNFIHPGGSQCGAALHLARTVCRRAERRVVRLRRAEPETGDVPVHYLNRLSDLLFVLARAVNHAAGVAEHQWRK